jgi:beta-lactamase regulating signal transducer with metallopeptidase domain
MGSAGTYAGLVSTALFAAMVFALPITLASAIVYSRLRVRLNRIEPSARARIFLLLAALPFIAALAGLLASFLPSLLSWAGMVADHCHLHPDHIHLCLVHPPQLAHTFVASMFVAAVGVIFGSIVLSWLLHMFHTGRLVRQLQQASCHDRARGLHIVDTDAPLAFAAGLREPRLFLSRMLVAQLPGAQLDAVIAHERAHAARHDALMQTIASALSHLHLPGARKRLLADLSLAAEQACDEAACAATGDRLVVAEAIIAVEKLFALHAPRQAPAMCATRHFNDSNVDARVMAILDAPLLERPRSRVFWATGGVAALALVALGDPLHHATESLLGLIFH